MNKKQKNLDKQIEFVTRNLTDGPGGLDRDYIMKLKDIIKGMDSENDDTRSENEERWVEEIQAIATQHYYDYLSRHYSVLNYKNEFYKACIYANDTMDFDEWEQARHGFERIVESALYKINELN